MKKLLVIPLLIISLYSFAQGTSRNYISGKHMSAPSGNVSLTDTITPQEFQKQYNKSGTETLDKIPTLAGWWDFTDPATVTTSTGISSITDKSGNSNTLSQGTNGPLYYSYGGNKDRGYAAFDSNQSLSKATFNYNQPYTLFMMIRLKNFHNNNVMFDLGGGYNKINQRETQKDNLLIQSWGNFNQQSSFQNEWVCVGFIVDGQNTKVMFNGVIAGVDELYSTPGGVAAVTQFQIGKDAKFDVSEVAFFSSHLSTQDAYRAYRYFQSKYNLDTYHKWLFGFGDSITAGANATVGYLERVGYATGLQIFNLGVGGSRLGDSPGMRNGQYQIIFNYVPKDSYTSIAFGTNEGSVGDPWYQEFRTIVRNIKAAGFSTDKIIVISPPYYSTRVAKNAAIASYAAQLSSEFGTKFADATTITQNNGGDALLTDSYHPLDPGHILISTPVIIAIGTIKL